MKAMVTAWALVTMLLTAGPIESARADAANLRPAAERERDEQRIASLIESARAAMAQADWPGAIDLLNEALNLPPTSRTPEAHEMVGVARLESGDVLNVQIVAGCPTEIR